MKRPAIIFLILAVALVAAVWFSNKYSYPKQPSLGPITTPEPTPVIPPAPVVSDLKGKQLIVFAFDGSKSLQTWKDTLDFAKTMTASGKPIHFTYFISGVYLLTYKNKALYQPPIYPAGTSPIGFADSKADLIERINFINRAVSEGNEIGSHLNGHFDGTKWTAADWEQEFGQFEKLLANVNTNNQITPAEAKLNISMKDIIGFRAPDLGRNNNLWPTLVAHNYLYDTSAVGKLGDWPKQVNGLWEFSIPQIKFADTNYHLLSMDYNFYVRQTNAQDLLRRGTPDWDQALDEMYRSYLQYFENNYTTSKAPVFIAHHFSAWNDGVYWDALKKFAAEECGKTDVRCVTYKQLMDFLNSDDNVHK